MGSGVVIGETAEVGDDVLIYMGVVLGGTALERINRHPTVEKDVVLGSGTCLSLFFLPSPQKLLPR